MTRADGRYVCLRSIFVVGVTDVTRFALRAFRFSFRGLDFPNNKMKKSSQNQSFAFPLIEMMRVSCSVVFPARLLLSPGGRGGRGPQVPHPKRARG